MAEIGAGIDTEIASKNPFEKLAKYLEIKGTEEEDEAGQHILQYKRKGVLKTHLSLPIIGTTDYKAILFNIRRNVDEPNSDIKIDITDREALEKAEKKGTKYTPTTITFSSKEGTTVTIAHPNDLWRWLGFNKNLWKDDPNGTFTTLSLDETEKIIDSFTNFHSTYGNEDDPDTTLHSDRIVEDPKLSRRSFFRLMGTGAKVAALDSILTHIPGSITPNLTAQFWEQLESQTIGISPGEWEKYLEDKMGVDIVGAGETVTSVDMEGTTQTVDWDSPRLKALFKVFAELPDNFRAAGRLNHAKLKLALVDEPRIMRHIKPRFSHLYSPTYAAGYCSCHNPEKPLVVLNKQSSGQTILEVDNTRKLIAHELTHVITTPNIQMYINTITADIGLSTVSELLATFATEVTIKPDVPIEKAGFDDIKDKSMIGYGARNFYEFFSVTAVNYLEGRDKFIETYKRFLGDDRSEKLYENMKKEIFQGREYYPL